VRGKGRGRGELERGKGSNIQNFTTTKQIFDGSVQIESLNPPIK
jgi:hypothetical protein